MIFKKVLLWVLLAIALNASTSFPIKDDIGKNGNYVQDGEVIYPKLLINKLINNQKMQTNNSIIDYFNAHTKDVYKDVLTDIIIKDSLGYISDSLIHPKADDNEISNQISEEEKALNETNKLVAEYISYYQDIILTLSSIKDFTEVTNSEKDFKTIQDYIEARTEYNKWKSINPNSDATSYSKIDSLKKLTQEYNKFDEALKSKFKYFALSHTKGILKEYAFNKIKFLINDTETQRTKKLELLDNLKDTTKKLEKEVYSLGTIDNDEFEKLYYISDLEQLKKETKNSLNNLDIKLAKLNDDISTIFNTDSSEEQINKIKAIYEKNKSATVKIANEKLTKFMDATKYVGTAIGTFTQGLKLYSIAYDKQETYLQRKIDELKYIQSIFNDDTNMKTATNELIEYLEGFKDGAKLDKIIDALSSDKYGTFKDATLLLDYASYFKVAEKFVGKFSNVLSIGFDVYDTFVDDSFLKSGTSSLGGYMLASAIYSRNTDNSPKKELLSHLFVEYGYAKLYSTYYWTPGVDVNDDTWMVALKMGTEFGGSATAGYVGILAKTVNIGDNMLGMLFQGDNMMDPYSNGYIQHKALYKKVKRDYYQINNADGSVVINKESIIKNAVVETRGSKTSILLDTPTLESAISIVGANDNLATYLEVKNKDTELANKKYRNHHIFGIKLLNKDSKTDPHEDTITQTDTSEPLKESLYYQESINQRGYIAKRYPFVDIRVDIADAKDKILQIIYKSYDGKSVKNIEIPLSKFTSNYTKTTEPTIDVDYLMKLIFINYKYSSLVWLSNAYPKEDEPHNIKIADGKAWSIIVQDPNHKEYVDIYYGKDENDYHAQRISTLTGYDHNGVQVIDYKYFTKDGNTVSYEDFDNINGDFRKAIITYIQNKLSSLGVTNTEEATKGSIENLDIVIPSDKPISTMTITAPSSATVDGRVIKASSSDEITLTFDKNYEYKQTIIDAGSQNKVYKILYNDYANNTTGTIEATYDETTNGLKFTVPTDDEIEIVKLSYPNDNGGYTEISFPTATKKVEAIVIQDTTTSSSGNTYQQCIDNGGTTIGCKVGLHLVGSIDTEGTPNAVKIQNNYAFVSDYALGLKIIDINDKTKPTLVGSIYTKGKIYGVDIKDNYAFVASGDNGLNIIDISDKTNPTLISSLDTDGRLFNIKVKDNYAFLADTNKGLKIIDISDKTNPTLVGSIDTDIVTAGDVDIQGNYAFVADYSQGLKIIDISDKAEPTLVSSIDTNGTAVNVKIKDNYAYIADNDKGLKIIDITDKENPTLVSSISLGQYTGEINIKGNYAFVVDNNKGIKIIDISDKENPTLVSSFSTDGYAQGIDIQDNYAYIADDYDGLKIVDVSNPIKAIESYNYSSGNYKYKIIIKDNYTYIADSSSLEILDINNVTNPIKKGSIRLSNDGEVKSLLIDGNYAYVSAGYNGLKIVDISDKTDPTLVSSLDTDGRVNQVVKNGSYIYVADGDKGLKVIDISDISNPVLKSTYDTSYFSGIAPYNYTVDSIAIKDNYIYVANANDLFVFDTSDPLNLTLQSYFHKALIDMTIKNNYIYAIEKGGIDNRGLNIIDISNPLNLKLKSYTDIEGGWYITVKDNYAFISTAFYNKGSKVIDISNPTNPKIKGTLDIGTVVSVNVKDNYALIGRQGSLKIVDIDKAIEYNSIIDEYYHPTTYINLISESPKDYEIEPSYLSGSANIFTKEWKFSKDISNFNVKIISNDYMHITTDDFTKNGDTLSVNLQSIDIRNGIKLKENKLVLKFTNAKGDPVKVDNSDTFWSLTLPKAKPTFDVEQIKEDITATKDNIASYYSDISNSAYAKYIKFATIKGAVNGQVDSTDASKHIFRPTDTVNWAEALKMVINSSALAGEITLPEYENLLKATPSWASKYYTYARENGAVDFTTDDLTASNVKNEDIAKLIVKTLHLDDRLTGFPPLTITFNDADDFSNSSYLEYGKIARAFGLFMTSNTAKPSEYITREKLAKVMAKIFMMPSADINLPQTKEYADNISFGELSNKKASTIDTSTFTDADSSSNITVQYALNGVILKDSTIDSKKLDIGENKVLALLDNNGVRNFVAKTINITYSDADADGVQDKNDVWVNDERYAYDDNSNGIPDILDYVYDLENKTSNDSIDNNGESITIAQIIRDGGYSMANTTVIPLKKGWNLISADISNIDNLNSNIKVMWRYKNSSWDAYSPDNTVQQNMQNKGIPSIANIGANDGTWILAKEDFELEVYVNETTSTTYPNGWSLNGTDKTLNISDVKCSSTTLESIFKYNNTTHSWSVYTTKNTSNNYETFEKIYPNEGFWVHCK